MTLSIRNVVRGAVEDAVVEGVAVLAGDATNHPGAPLVPLHFANGLATAPRALPRQGFGLAARLLVPPGTWAVVYLPGGEQRSYAPGSHWIFGAGPGAILVQWVDARRQQLPVGPVEGWSADKWRVALWLIVDVEVLDPALVATHADPLGALVAAVRVSALHHIEQHMHAELTGCAGDRGGVDAPARAVAERLRDDPALEGLRVISVRVLDRQGDERQIEAATAATVAAAQIDEGRRIAEARNRARLHELEGQTTIAEREHALRMATTAATVRERLLMQQAEVQQAALAARLEIVLAQIRAQTTEIAHDEQIWQAEQARLQAEWDRVQQQQCDAHQVDQQLRLLDAQHGISRMDGDLAVAIEDRRSAHELALAEVEQRLSEQRAAQVQAIIDRRAQHEQALLDLQFQHERLVVEQMRQLEQWRSEQRHPDTQQQRQHEC